ncbi:MAG: cysteine rich repeat-containing protein [Pseudolabrys sp.]
MKILVSAAFVLAVSAGTAFAVDERQPEPGNFFQGTPQEQAACNPDATRYCVSALPDTFRVLACLQDHRKKLRKACLKVLEDHGQ